MQVEANLGISIQERRQPQAITQAGVWLEGRMSSGGLKTTLPRSRKLPSLTAIERKRACEATVFVEGLFGCRFLGAGMWPPTTEGFRSHADNGAYDA